VNASILHHVTDLPAGRKRFALATLVCLWLAYLLPSAVYSQWFTLDMGGMWTRAAAPGSFRWAVSPDALGGRFFPVYWFYNFLLFDLFGTRIGAHFLSQAVLFVVSLLLTCHLFARITGNLLATVALGVAICLGGAVAENVYTLGKAEPLAYLFLVTALAAFHRFGARRGRPPAWTLAAIAALVALAMWTKETSLVMLAFCPGAAIAGAYAARVPLRHPARLPHLPAYGWLFAAVIAGLALARTPYLLAMRGGGATSYVDYQVNAELVGDNLAFYASQQPDVLLLGIAALVAMYLAARRMRARAGELPSRTLFDFMFVGGMLATAWGYYAGLIVWRWPMGYYMLLPSILFKFVALYGALLAIGEGRLAGRPLRAAYAFGAVTVLYAAIHTYYVVTSQVSYSRMYTEAVSRYVALSRPGERLVIESFPFYSEQVTNTRQVIALMSGEDRVVGGIADLLNPAVVTPEIVKLLRLLPQQLEDNERAFPHRGDYVLVMTGNKLATWFVRGVTPYFSDDSLLLKEREYDMIPVAENRSYVPAAFMHVWTYGLQYGPTYIGYKLYRVTSERPRILWRGRYPDGWMGKSASIRLFPEYGKRAVITMSTPAFNTPNRVTVTQDGVKIRDLVLAEGREESFEVENSGDRVPTRIGITVQKTVVPKELELNQDKREIGILVRIEPRS